MFSNVFRGRGVKYIFSAVFIVVIVFVFNFLFSFGLSIYDVACDGKDYCAEVVESSFSADFEGDRIRYLKVSLKNTGVKPWNLDGEFKLGVVGDFSKVASIRNFGYGVVLPGDVYVFDVVLYYSPGVGFVNDSFQMVYDGYAWFGDIINVKSFDYDFVGKSEFDKIKLILSNSDLKHLKNISYESQIIGIPAYNLNDWRKIDVLWNDEVYPAEMKIHGDSLNHYLFESQSYKIRLMDFAMIDGYNEFSLINFKDRSYYSYLLTSYAKNMNLYTYDYNLLNLSLNNDFIGLIYLRGNKSELFFLKNRLSNFVYISKSTLRDRLLNKYVVIGGGGHQNFMDFEPSFVDIFGDAININKNNYYVSILNSMLISDSLDIIKLFDYDYLLDFEVMRTLFGINHDVEGDNFRMFISESLGFFYPIVSAESFYKYKSVFFEKFINSGFCFNDGYGSGDFIKIFELINRNNDFRQDKYRRLYNLLLDDKYLDFLNLNEIFDINFLFIYSMNNLRLNTNLLLDVLTDSTILLNIDNSDEIKEIDVNVLSISEIDIRDFIIKFDSELTIGDVVKVNIIYRDEILYFEYLVDVIGSQLSLSDVFLDYTFFLDLDEEFFYLVEPIEIYIESSLDIVDLDLNSVNLVTNQKLTDFDIKVFFDKNLYNLELNSSRFLMNETNVSVCLGENSSYNIENTPDVDVSSYLELWKLLLSEGSISQYVDVYNNFVNYDPNFLDNELTERLKYDLSLSKIYINVIEENNLVNIELIPVSISNLGFDNFILHISNVFESNQNIKITVEDYWGKEYLSDFVYLDVDDNKLDLGDVLSEFYFSGVVENGRFYKTKYFIKLDFIDFDGDLFISDTEVEGKNSITDEKIDKDDIVVAISDANQFYWEERFYTLDEMLKNYNYFYSENGNLVMRDYIRVVDDLIIPYDLNLEIKPGTKIVLDPGVSILSYSKIIAIGTEDKPIVVKSSSDIKPFGAFGLVNEGSDGSNIEYMDISNGSESYINGIYLSGMFSAYNVDDVIVSNSIFSYAKADDALNFKYSNSSVLNSTFKNNSADAIDFDFMEGEIVDSIFIDNGNDSIDTSGSSTYIFGNKIYNSGDKCMSFGEDSDPVVINNLMDGCKIGVEVKDLSRPVIINNVITNNELGINSYQKKEFFGGGHATVVNTIFSQNGEDVTFLDTFKGKNLDTDDSDIEISYSILDGGYEGDSNLDLYLTDGVYVYDKKGDNNKLLEYYNEYSDDVAIGLLN